MVLNRMAVPFTPRNFVSCNRKLLLFARYMTDQRQKVHTLQDLQEENLIALSGLQTTPFSSQVT